MKKTILTLLLVMVSCVATQAQMVGATNRQQGGFSDAGYGQNDVGRQRGPLLHFELGLPCAVSLGYQISPVLMVGAGIGASALVTEYAPIFAQVRLNTPHNHRSLFLDFKGGYDLANDQGPIFLGQIGMLFKYIGVGVGMGYSTAYNGSERLKFCLTASYDLPLNKILY